MKALRRQQKPVSGKLGERNQTIASGREVNGLETSTQASYQSTSHVSYSSTTLSSSSSSSRLPTAASKPTGLPVKSPRKKKSLEQASRSAKKKWDIIDKKVIWCGIVFKSNVSVSSKVKLLFFVAVVFCFVCFFSKRMLFLYLRWRHWSSRDRPLQIWNRTWIGGYRTGINLVNN